MYKPLTIKGITISTPFFFAPINTGLAIDGCPTEKLISFHEKKSNVYTGLNYVGNIAISRDYTTNENTLYITKKMEAYESLASHIRNKGSLPAAQIAAYKANYTPQYKWRNSNIDKYKEHITNEI